MSQQTLFRQQSRLPWTAYWRHCAGGCRLNLKIDEMIGDAGFEVGDLKTMYLPGPRPMTFNYWGSASV